MTTTVQNYLDKGLRGLWYPVLASWEVQSAPVGITRLGEQIVVWRNKDGQVQALEAAEASSQSALDANKLGYQVGVRINIDVLNAQSQLYQTKRDLAQARYNVLLGTLKLRQAAGTLSLEDVQRINSLLAPAKQP